MKIVSTILAASLAMTLAACGGSDEVAEETTAGTVEVPADEAMTGVEAPVITDTAPVVTDTGTTTAQEASEPVADAGDPTQTTADEAERVADEAAAAAEAATDSVAGEF
ncbi:hypothetical protein [Altericroceibacterium xinjiangense]|uniref:hypothetical protein n=1 Tax=Altericroceibacterium xinjiangense TaxID=762261 RepID=UPI000F7F0C3F|nr:hypothetical protein [Altericroceibacterium xinjiangense]